MSLPARSTMKCTLVADATCEVGAAVASRLAGTGHRVLACGFDAALLAELDSRLSQPELHRMRASTSAANAGEWIQEQNVGLDHLVLVTPLGQLSPTASGDDRHGAGPLGLQLKCLTPAGIQSSLLRRYVLESNEWVRSCLPALHKGKKPKKITLVHELPDTRCGVSQVIASALDAQTRELARELAPHCVHINALFARYLATEQRTLDLCNAAGATPGSPEAAAHIEQAAKALPLRQFVPLQALAHQVETLLGPFTDHVTGQIFTLDSGAAALSQTNSPPTLLER